MAYVFMGLLISLGVYCFWSIWLKQDRTTDDEQYWIDLHNKMWHDP